MQNKSRHLCAGLANGEDRIGLFSPQLRKRPWARIWGLSTQRSQGPSFSSHSDRLLRACGNCFKYTFTTSLPTQPTSLISSSSHALNIFLNSKVLSGYQTSRSDSFTIFIFSYTQQTCMENLLCAGLVAPEKVESKIGSMPAFGELPVQQGKADIMLQINSQIVVSFWLS